MQKNAFRTILLIKNSSFRSSPSSSSFPSLSFGSQRSNRSIMHSHPFSSVPSSSFLQFGKIGVQDNVDPSHTEVLPDSISLTGLSVRMLVGVDNWERVKPQPIKIDVQIHTDVSKAGKADHLPHSIHYGILTKELESHCSVERYRSLEALAEGLAKVCIFKCRAPKVTLRVQKPRSLLHADSAGVQIIRTASDFVTTDGRNAEEVFAPQSTTSIVASTEDQSSLRLSGSSYWAQHDRVFVKDLCISTILGVNPWERVDKQIVRINLEVFSGLERLRQAALIGSNKATIATPTVDMVTKPQNYRTIVRSISDHVQRSNYKTVESLALSIAEIAVNENRVERIRVRVDKPSAIMFAESAGVEVERDRSYFESINEKETAESAVTPASMSANFTAKATDAAFTSMSESEHDWHVAAIALGSNVGDRFANIERAVTLLSSSKDCKLVDTSFLYETEPKYYINQPKFINGACRIATKLDPHALLQLCQSIEKEIGRDKRGVPIKGPRAIDLDILLYDRIELNTEHLIIPHAGIVEREFVLRPLMDILPEYRHPNTSRTISQLHSILINSEDYTKEEMRRVLPLQIEQKGKIAWSWGTKTYVMGIINATPDSFSDGGDNVNVQNAVRTAKAMVEEGVDILDIGGMSTAPNAREIDEDEEIERIVPVIKAIRSANSQIPISIDTFRANVARAALEAGATMINDVTAGVREPAIFDVAREFSCPIILMHMRGDSSTMNSLAQYAGNDVVRVVSKELENRIENALRQGVLRWNIILDPGIGFAKNADGNLQLLRGLAKIRNGSGNGGMGQSRSNSPPPTLTTSMTKEEGPSLASLEPNLSLKSFPLLVGPSRKRFLGTITGRSEAKDRMAGTAAACTAAILAGADIIRVHDVKEMVDVAKTADAIARGGEEEEEEEVVVR